MFRLTDQMIADLMGGAIGWDAAANDAQRALIAVAVMARVEESFGHRAIRDVALISACSPQPFWRAMGLLAQFRSREYTDEMLAEEASA